jgi:hypothetical protein
MARPKFIKSLLDSWQLSLSQSREIDLIPYWILASAAVGAATAYNLPTAFWDGTKLDTTVSLMSGLLTFNGIILALCWSAFAKVYEIVGAGAFCAHLRKHNLLSHYLVFVGYCHAVQVVAMSITAFGLFSFWLPLQLWFVKIVLGASVAATVYAVRQGVATSAVMQDLIWSKSEFDASQPATVFQAAAK